MVRPKLFAPNHQVRLYLEDEAKLERLPGKTPAAKIRELVHEALMPALLSTLPPERRVPTEIY